MIWRRHGGHQASAPGIGGVLRRGAPATDDVVTIAGASSSLPGTEAGSAKVTPLAEYPAEGRATGGVRAHRFLKGEDTLLLAAIGPRPVVAAAASGSPVDLPPTDGAATAPAPLAQPVAMLAGRAGPVTAPHPRWKSTRAATRFSTSLSTENTREGLA